MDDDSVNILLPPRAVCERVGVSASGLRRLATLWEGLYGPLPRDPSDSRLWPSEAVDRLVAARQLVSQGRARSIQDALQAAEHSDTPPSEGLTPRATLQGEALGALVEEMRVMRAEIAELKEGVQRQLQAPREDVAKLEAENADLKQRNAALFGELERRPTETATSQRPWWRFWGRP